MNQNQTIKIIELRNYLMKRGARDRFIEYFGEHFVGSQNDLGGFVLGAYRIEEQADRFFWIRGFSDMNSRSRFLPEFYGGEVWKKFSPEANEMMLEWHNVHLLKPLGEIEAKDFFTGKPLTVVDFYFAAENDPAKLTGLFQKSGKFSGSTLWTAEMSANDFPRLPVIQDENLLTAITNYDEAEFASPETLKNVFGDVVKRRERLVLSRAF